MPVLELESPMSRHGRGTQSAEVVTESRHPPMQAFPYGVLGEIEGGRDLAEGARLENVLLDDVAILGRKPREGPGEPLALFATLQARGDGGHRRCGLGEGAPTRSLRFQVTPAGAVLRMHVLAAILKRTARQRHEPCVQRTIAAKLDLREEFPGSRENGLEEVVGVRVRAEASRGHARDEERERGRVRRHERFEGPAVAALRLKEQLGALRSGIVHDVGQRL